MREEVAWSWTLGLVVVMFIAATVMVLWSKFSEPREVRRTCLPTEHLAEKRAAFIIQCATAANPKSDEEGEDLVEQCEETASRLYCHHVWAVADFDHFVACEHADPEGQEDCMRAGWGR